MADERPQDTVSNVPVVMHGVVHGRAELKGNIITIELDTQIERNYIDYLRMGLMTGFLLEGVYIEAHTDIKIHPIETEHYNG